MLGRRLFDDPVGRTSVPARSAVGVATVTILEPSRAGYITLAVPLFNLEPAQGEPARFGFVADAVPVVLDTSVRTGGDYGVTVSVNDASAAAQVLGAQVTFWGEPDSESPRCLPRLGVLARRRSKGTPAKPARRPKAARGIPLLTLPTAVHGRAEHPDARRRLDWTAARQPNTR